MSIKTHKINNVVVKAAPMLGDGNKKPPRGLSLFSEPFANIYLSAKKKSGKTSNIFFILSHIIGKDTKLIIFCSTVHRDPTWLFMTKYFKEKGIEVESHTSLKEDGVDLLAVLVKQLENEIASEETESETDSEEEPDPKELLKMRGAGIRNAILLHNLPPVLTGEGEEKKKPRKSKYTERKYVIVMDDLSTELKSKSLVGLLKKNRHFETCCILSSQYYLDILPESRKQIQYFLLYKGQTDDKLEAIYKDADVTIDYTEFTKLYRDATSEPFNFLYVDTVNDEFRKNYNIVYETTTN